MLAVAAERTGSPRRALVSEKRADAEIKKRRRLKKEGGNLLRGIPPMRQKLCPGFVEDANAIDRRDTHDPGDC